MMLSEILATYRDGEEHGWEVEFEWLIVNHTRRMIDLIEDIWIWGIQSPVLLGHDGRVWDGHHRLLAAVILGGAYLRVPVEFAPSPA